MTKKLPTPVRVLITIAKIIWFPLLLAVSFALGLYIGFGQVEGASGRQVFDAEVWKTFFNQLRALRGINP